MVLARWMNWRSISSVAMKSAITPSRIGRISSIGSGVRPSMVLAFRPTASITRSPPRTCTATTDGSSMMMPRPTTCTSVLAVPRSMAISSEKARETPESIHPTMQSARPAPAEPKSGRPNGDTPFSAMRADSPCTKHSRSTGVLQTIGGD